jgi:hypothetical protein
LKLRKGVFLLPGQRKPSKRNLHFSQAQHKGETTNGASKLNANGSQFTLGSRVTIVGLGWRGWTRLSPYSFTIAYLFLKSLFRLSPHLSPREVIHWTNCGIRLTKAEPKLARQFFEVGTDIPLKLPFNMRSQLLRVSSNTSYIYRSETLRKGFRAHSRLCPKQVPVRGYPDRTPRGACNWSDNFFITFDQGSRKAEMERMLEGTKFTIIDDIQSLPERMPVIYRRLTT